MSHGRNIVAVVTSQRTVLGLTLCSPQWRVVCPLAHMAWHLGGYTRPTRHGGRGSKKDERNDIADGSRWNNGGGFARIAPNHRNEPNRSMEFCVCLLHRTYSHTPFRAAWHVVGLASPQLSLLPRQTVPLLFLPSLSYSCNHGWQSGCYHQLLHQRSSYR